MTNTLYSYLPCGFMVYLGLYVCVRACAGVVKGEIDRIVMTDDEFLSQLSRLCYESMGKAAHGTF